MISTRRVPEQFPTNSLKFLTLTDRFVFDMLTECIGPDHPAILGEHSHFSDLVVGHRIMVLCSFSTTAMAAIFSEALTYPDEILRLLRDTHLDFIWESPDGVEYIGHHQGCQISHSNMTNAGTQFDDIENCTCGGCWTVSNAPRMNLREVLKNVTLIQAVNSL